MQYLVVLKNGDGEYGFACDIKAGVATFMGSESKEEALSQIPDNYNEMMDRGITWQTTAGLHFSNCKTSVCEFNSWSEVEKFVQKPFKLLEFGSAITRTQQNGIAIEPSLYQELEDKTIKKTILYEESE